MNIIWVSSHLSIPENEMTHLLAHTTPNSSWNFHFHTHSPTSENVTPDFGQTITREIPKISSLTLEYRQNPSHENVDTLETLNNESKQKQKLQFIYIII